MLDLLIRGALTVDPESGFCSRADIGIEDGVIVRVAESVDEPAETVFDAEGLAAVPGLIDTHLHLAPHPYGERMAAASGVTTCVEMAGPADRVFAGKLSDGCGLSVAVLNAVLPGTNVGGRDPSAAELDDFIERSLSEGSFGVKLLGGHFPLTPEASARMVEESARLGAYMAWHAGTLTAGSDIDGMRQAVELAEGRPFHLAHINAYCRGRVRSELAECEEAASLLRAHPEIVTESYLSARSGAPLVRDENGDPLSKVVCGNLRRFGFTPDRKGLRQAVLDGVLSVILPEDGMLKLVSGRSGADALEEGRAADGSFDRVNPAVSRVYFATARRDDGTFLVDGIATDGGAIPRNVIAEAGLALVGLSALTLTEFAAKTSLIPARMLGLEGKGHIAPGFDADITLLSVKEHRAAASFAAGRPVLLNGRVVGQGGSVLCTEQGAAAVRRAGLTPQVIKGGIPALSRCFG